MHEEKDTSPFMDMKTKAEGDVSALADQSVSTHFFGLSTAKQDDTVLYHGKQMKQEVCSDSSSQEDLRLQGERTWGAFDGLEAHRGGEKDCTDTDRQSFDSDNSSPKKRKKKKKRCRSRENQYLSSEKLDKNIKAESGIGHFKESIEENTGNEDFSQNNRHMETNLQTSDKKKKKKHKKRNDSVTDSEKLLNEVGLNVSGQPDENPAATVLSTDFPTMSNHLDCHADRENSENENTRKTHKKKKKKKSKREESPECVPCDAGTKSEEREALLLGQEQSKMAEISVNDMEDHSFEHAGAKLDLDVKKKRKRKRENDLGDTLQATGNFDDIGLEHEENGTIEKQCSRKKKKKKSKSKDDEEIISNSFDDKVDCSQNLSNEQESIKFKKTTKKRKFRDSFEISTVTVEGNENDFPGEMVTYSNNQRKQEDYGCSKKKKKKSRTDDGDNHRPLTQQQGPAVSSREAVDAGSSPTMKEPSPDDNNIPSCDTPGRRESGYPKPCYVCEVSMETRSKYIEHLAQQHNKRSYQCPKCTRPLSSLDCVKHHLKISCTNKHGEHAITPFKCHVCPATFKFSHNCYAHLRQVHSVRKTKTFGCRFCGKELTSQYRIGVHEKRCGEGLIYKQNAHNVERKECPECGKLFSKNSLLYHRKSIHQLLVFSCLCGKQYRSSIRYYTHRKQCDVISELETVKEK